MKNLSILKKMLVLALSAAMLLTVLTGCGSSETAAPQDEQATEAQAEEQPAAEASTLLEQIKAKGKAVDAKSMLMIMSMGLVKGTEITIAADGEDEAAAVKALKDLVVSKFGEE